MSRLLLRFADCLGALLFVAGAWEAYLSFAEPLGYFDEGLLVSHAYFMSRGLVPHADFYANYPPGASALVAAAWILFGTGVWPVRCLGLGVRILTAVLAGRLAGRLSRRTFSLLACGSVMAWLSPLPLSPFAWVLGLCLALIFSLLLLRAVEVRGVPSFLVAGMALGAVGAARHDLFAFLVVGLIVLSRAVRFRPTFRLVATLAAGTVLPLLTAFGPVVLRGGFGEALTDLIFDQVGVLAHRHLPLPVLLAPVAMPGLSFDVPAFLAGTVSAGAAAALVAPIASTAWFLVCGRPAVAIASLLSFAVVPEMLGRPDRVHVLSCSAPAIVLLIGFAERSLARSGVHRTAACLLMALVSLPYALGGHRDDPPPQRIRIASFGPLDERNPKQREAWIASNRRKLLGWLRQNTGYDERLFVGEASHASVYANEASLYFLAERLPATRYAQFDPAIITREKTQARIIAELESRRTRVVVLSSRTSPDDSAGSTRLDTYLAQAFRPVATFGPFVVRLRETARPRNPSLVPSE